MSRRLLLFDDATARSWSPLALTRPAGEVLFGTLLLRERIEQALGIQASAYLGPDELRGFREDGAPPVTEDVSKDDERLLLATRYVPPREGLTLPNAGDAEEGSRRGILFRAAGHVVGCLLPPGAPLPSASWRASPSAEGEAGSPAVHDIPGEVLPDLWTLVALNPERVAADLEAPGRPSRSTPVEALGTHPGVHVLGDHPVTVGEGVEVDPEVVLDARLGPIHLADGVKVRSLTVVEGPTWVGPGSVLLGGRLSAVSCGPGCKLHGEVDSSVILGYSNKAHAGYLGHALLGRWVNLGAFTTNSDLKNTYGTVRVPAPGGDGEVDTGLMKVGVFMGDHAKTGIGTLLNTGTVVGAGSNLFGGAMPPRYVPPFSWGSGRDLGSHMKDKFLSTARTVMARRQVELDPGMEGLLARAWERTRRNPEAGGEDS
jgi:UDP-N-acetylglucosamine diphosphorylase / glucose-1-phosphate thymidylyltransferase / UDP-N-acetylgalactosamine diphosphorylase / glucosamine-1-phosphate N-acetyltransferase / galactosamine-1-phosphate N-acetyltransferase